MGFFDSFMKPYNLYNKVTQPQPSVENLPLHTAEFTAFYLNKSLPS